MNIANLILDSLARGIRIGRLDPNPPMVVRIDGWNWVLDIDDDRWSVSVRSADLGRIEATIHRHDRIDEDYQDESGSIIIDPDEIPIGIVACQYFGELCGSLRSGWGGMDSYYPEEGIQIAHPWYPDAVHRRMRIGGDR